MSLALAFACASLPVAHAQEPPGCSVKSSPKKHSHAKPAQHSEISGKLPKRKVLDLRRHKTAEPEEAPSIPVIASPIYLPQAGTNGTAITASNGYLYVVVGERLYKVNEKTLKTVQVSALGNREVERTTSTATSKRRHKVVASTGDEPSPHKTTKKRRASKTD
ncbi:MAG TPA: hypothetical protein VHE55_14075 [Fimbriimonadaceae bacterium]|nr:hypothetical protein [Fimbriimonadaceae bacterium]